MPNFFFFENYRDRIPNCLKRWWKKKKFSHKLYTCHALTNFTHFCNFSLCLLIQPPPLRKHAIGYNLGLKWLNYAKEKL